MTKKKEELAVGRDLTIESLKKPEEPYVVFKHRLIPAVIDETATVRMTEPPMTDPVMNMLCFMMTGKSLEELDD